MSGIARAVARGEPRLVTQRFDGLTALAAGEPPHGVFFGDDGYEPHPDVMSASRRERGEEPSGASGQGFPVAALQSK